jgi:NAD(P)-dependent dehydrogenase (short-subunit alcohol dehydrogenase family)
MSTVLITGANRGIGLELARLCAGRGDQVVAVCRKASPVLEQLGVQVEAGVELTSERDVVALVERLAGVRVDVAILNAGILERGALGDLDVESIRRQFEVNAVAPLRLVAALAPALAKGSKIALITSRMGSIGDNSSGGSYGYRMSKVALNMAGVSLAHDLAPRDIAVGIYHPGYVRTGMTGGSGNLDASESAALLLARIGELSPAATGGFWHASGERLPW